MKLRKILALVLFFVAAPVISEVLALVSEGFAYQHSRATPGMIIARRLIAADPVSSNEGWELMAKRMPLELKVDMLIWLVILCGIAATVVIVRRRRRVTGPR